MNQNDIAYIAGLFDGEGCVTYKQRMKKRGEDKKAYPTWDIRMEVNMTDKSVIQWVHETLGVGTFGKKPPGKGKLHKIEQIIDHYEQEFSEDNVVSIEDYRK